MADEEQPETTGQDPAPQIGDGPWAQDITSRFTDPAQAAAVDQFFEVSANARATFVLSYASAPWLSSSSDSHIDSARETPRFRSQSSPSEVPARGRYSHPIHP